MPRTKGARRHQQRCLPNNKPIASRGRKGDISQLSGVVGKRDGKVSRFRERIATREYTLLEFAGGLGPIGLHEMRVAGPDYGILLQNNPQIVSWRECDYLRLGPRVSLQRLTDLRLISAIYRCIYFGVQRPDQILSDREYASALRSLLKRVVEQASALGFLFSAVRLNAAGAESPQLQALASFISSTLAMPIDNREGDLLIRFRHPPGSADGWELMVRATPRPLSVRSPTRLQFAGSANAPLAATMSLLTDPSREDIFLDIGCGSGTISIERAELGSSRAIFGVDIDSRALALAARNMVAANLQERVTLCLADATKLPFKDRLFTAICGNLPWGERIGKREHNSVLYSKIIKEAGRVARPGGRLVLLSQHLSALNSAFSQQRLWSVNMVIPISQRGFKPAILVASRERC